MFWDDYKWAGAAFSFLRPNDMKEYYPDAIRPEPGIHFAGEHCSMDQAWMQGAALSALRVVDEIVSL
jgi:monoamine oxidase